MRSEQKTASIPSEESKPSPETSESTAEGTNGDSATHGAEPGTGKNKSANSSDSSSSNKGEQTGQKGEGTVADASNSVGGAGTTVGDSGGSDSQEPRGKESEGSPSGNKTQRAAAGDPVSALKKAKSKFQEAESSARDGDASDAFVAASDALSLVRRYPKDAECSALAKQIETRLAELAKTLRNRPEQRLIEDSSKTLVEK